METNRAFKNNVSWQLGLQPYMRCGKELRREYSTCQKYASILLNMRNKCGGVGNDLSWLETHMLSFLSLYERVTEDRTVLRRYVRELTALRAGAELIHRPHVVQAYGTLASELQRKIMGQEMKQEQDPKEKESYKSFAQLRCNARQLFLELQTPPFKSLLYELMVPEDGSYALRLDVRTLVTWDGVGPAPQHNYITQTGEIVFHSFKTSKFKRGDSVTIAITPNAKRALQAVWTHVPPNTHLFTDSQGRPFSQPAFSKYVQDAWIMPGTPPNAQNIRSAIITRFMNGIDNDNARPSLLSTKAFATRSMTSPAMLELVYHKMLTE
jgi:hypothetical protein